MEKVLQRDKITVNAQTVSSTSKQEAKTTSSLLLLALFGAGVGYLASSKKDEETQEPEAFNYKVTETPMSEVLSSEEIIAVQPMAKPADEIFFKDGHPPPCVPEVVISPKRLSVSFRYPPEDSKEPRYASNFEIRNLEGQDITIWNPATGTIYVNRESDWSELKKRFESTFPAATRGGLYNEMVIDTIRKAVNSHPLSIAYDYKQVKLQISKFLDGDEVVGFVWNDKKAHRTSSWHMSKKGNTWQTNGCDIFTEDFEFYLKKFSALEAKYHELQIATIRETAKKIDEQNTKNQEDYSHHFKVSSECLADGWIQMTWRRNELSRGVVDTFRIKQDPDHADRLMIKCHCKIPGGTYTLEDLKDEMCSYNLLICNDTSAVLENQNRFINEVMEDILKHSLKSKCHITSNVTGFLPENQTITVNARWNEDGEHKSVSWYLAKKDKNITLIHKDKMSRTELVNTMISDYPYANRPKNDDEYRRMINLIVDEAEKYVE